jgi:hypothetical protein
MGQDTFCILEIASPVAKDLTFLERRAKGEGFRSTRRDQTAIPASERSRTGLATVRSTHLPTQDRNPRTSLFDRQGMYAES